MERSDEILTEPQPACQVKIQRRLEARVVREAEQEGRNQQKFPRPGECAHFMAIVRRFLRFALCSGSGVSFQVNTIAQRSGTTRISAAVRRAVAGARFPPKVPPPSRAARFAKPYQSYCWVTSWFALP